MTARKHRKPPVQAHTCTCTGLPPRTASLSLNPSWCSCPGLGSARPAAYGLPPWVCAPSSTWSGRPARSPELASRLARQLSDLRRGIRLLSQARLLSYCSNLQSTFWSRAHGARPHDVPFSGSRFWTRRAWLVSACVPVRGVPSAPVSRTSTSPACSATERARLAPTARSQ